MAQGEPEEHETADGGLSAEFKRKLRDLRVCLVCGPLHRFNKSHARGGHKMRSLNESEKAEEISWYRTIQAEGETARLRILDHRRQESQKAYSQLAASEDTSEPAERGVGGDYKIEFGKHARKSLSNVLKAFPDYFPNLVNEKRFLASQPLLARALEEAGVLENVQARAAVLQLENAKITLQRAADEKAQGTELHPEVRKLPAIQVEKARSVLNAPTAEDLDKQDDVQDALVHAQAPRKRQREKDDLACGPRSKPVR